MLLGLYLHCVGQCREYRRQTSKNILWIKINLKNMHKIYNGLRSIERKTWIKLKYVCVVCADCRCCVLWVTEAIRFVRALYKLISTPICWETSAGKHCLQRPWMTPGRVSRDGCRKCKSTHCTTSWGRLKLLAVPWENAKLSMSCRSFATSPSFRFFSLLFSVTYCQWLMEKIWRRKIKGFEVIFYLWLSFKIRFMCFIIIFKIYLVLHC